MDVRSDTERKYQDRKLQSNNENHPGFQNDHGETTELVRECDEER